MLNDGASAYAYNAANRLISVNGPEHSVSFSYNGLGDRLQQTINGVPTNYTLDLAAGLTQVLADDTNTYLYGLGRIAQQNTDTLMTDYFLGDALGSVRQLVDPTGVVTLSQSYAPYGDTLNSVGVGSSVYQFTGEAKDHYIKLIHLRSRFYAPEFGRFMTKDIWQGDYARPLSLNRWMYTEGNPVNFTDPRGLYTQGQIKKIMGAATYEEVLDRFRSGALAGQWGFLWALHHVENGDRLTIYDFPYSCAMTNPRPGLAYKVRTPDIRISIDGNLFALLGEKTGELYFHDEHGLLLLDGNKVGRNVLGFVPDADFFQWTKGSGFSYSTWATEKYSFPQVIHDKIDWPSFWWSVEELASVGLIMLGTGTANPYLVIPGIVGEGAALTRDFVNLWQATSPVLNDILSMQDASSSEIEKMINSSYFIAEHGIETLFEAAGRRVPFFAIKDLATNIIGAIQNVP